MTDDRDSYLEAVAAICGGAGMNWCRSHRFDPAACRIADRHYSRQKIGSPQFVRAGSCCVLLTDDGLSLWVTSWQQSVDHDWPDAWDNTLFYRGGGARASVLISQAIAATRAHYGDPPAMGMITMIDRDKVRPTMVHGVPVWGWSYRRVGFVEVGETKVRRRLVLQLEPGGMPAPVPARPRSMHGAPLFDGVAG